jgi:hypothetical protein
MQKNVYKLIAGLSSAEKRQFDLWSKRYGEDRQYMVLYREIVAFSSEFAAANPIDTANSFSESQLLNRLAEKGFTQSSLQDSKNYLYDVLLASLRTQQEKESQDYLIKTILEEARLLERRGMADAAIEKYQTALKAAEKIEHYTSAIEAIKGLVALSAQFDPKNYVEVLSDYLNKLEQFSLLQKEESKLFSLNYQAFTLVRTQRNFNDSERMKQITNLTESLGEFWDTSDSFFTSVYKYSTKASLSILGKKTDDAKHNYQEIIKIWENPKNKHMKEVYVRTYIIFLGNYLTYCISAKDKKSFHQYCKILESINPKYIDDEAELFQNLKYVQHLYYLNNGDLDDAYSMNSDIKTGLIKYATKISQARKRTFNFNMMLVSFGLKKYDDAMEHLEHLYVKSPHREDLATVAKLFDLIIQYKKRSHKELDSRIKSLTENLKYNKHFHDFERTVLKNLSKLIRLQQVDLLDPIIDKKEFEDTFKAFYKDLLDLKNSNGFEKPSGFDAVLLWVRSEVDGKAFSELLKTNS